MSAQLRLTPVTPPQLREFLTEHARGPVPADVAFTLGVADDSGELVGVLVAAAPHSSWRSGEDTLEITHHGNNDSAARMLYIAARRAATGLNYHRLITQTRAGENTAAVRAAGFHPITPTQIGRGGSARRLWWEALCR